MGGGNSKPKMDYILDVKWDITESPDKSLCIKLPNNTTSLVILCPVKLKKLIIESITIKSKNTSNIIPYLDIFSAIYKLYYNYKYRIISYAKDNNLPIEIYFKQLIYIKHEHKDAIYKLVLSD